MRRVVLQPAANKGARKHYNDTIANPVVLADHIASLGVDGTRLGALYPDGRAPLWGATPGRNDANIGRWERMAVGDYVFFAFGGRVRRGATVTDVFRNAVAAEQLWGRDEKDQTWELMFALDELRDFDMPYAELNSVVGYKANNVIQGFTVLDEAKSASVFDYFGLDSDVHLLDRTDAEFAVATASELPAGPTDLVATTKLRIEQDYLRRRLFQQKNPACALCGHKYPPQFLVAAHIKKRSACDEHERRDFAAIAMLACKFGCDALFEEGYLAVSDGGLIEMSAYAPSEGAAYAYLSQLRGRTCSAWAPASEKYFRWHRSHTFFRAAHSDLPDEVSDTTHNVK